MPMIQQAKRARSDPKRKRTSIGRKPKHGNKHNRRKADRGQGWPR